MLYKKIEIKSIFFTKFIAETIKAEKNLGFFVLKLYFDIFAFFIGNLKKFSLFKFEPFCY